MTRFLLALALFAPSAAHAAPKKIVAELDKTFVLRLGEVAALKGEDASVRILGFTNSPCPKGARCVWSGQAVHLELTVAGSTVALGGGAPYQVLTINSDYKTHASLKASRTSQKK